MYSYITGKLKFQRRPKSYWITTRALLNFTLRFSSLDNQPIIQYFSPTCWKTEALADGIIQKEITKHTRCTLEKQTACKPKKEFQHDVPLPGSDFQVSRGNSTMTWIIEISQSTMSSYKTTLSRNQEIFNFPCIFWAQGWWCWKWHEVATRLPCGAGSTFAPYLSDGWDVEGLWTGSVVPFWSIHLIKL